MSVLCKTKHKACSQYVIRHKAKLTEMVFCSYIDTPSFSLCASVIDCNIRTYVHVFPLLYGEYSILFSFDSPKHNPLNIIISSMFYPLYAYIATYMAMDKLLWVTLRLNKLNYIATMYTLLCSIYKGLISICN